MATAAQISTLYNKYLGRDPLQGGIDAWLATGQSIEQIEQGIANSPEAGVFQAFNETVGRDPTMEERDFFVNENPIGTNAVKNLLSGMEEAKAFQTQQQLDETDMLADTTAGDTTLDDTTVGGETETAFPTADTGRFGDMIDASATFAAANEYLGVNEAQWSAFVNEVNDIKAQMNAFEGNEARVMQDRSTPDALLDRRIAVLLNQNPGMTADEARAEAQSGEAYQQLAATNEQYNALNERLNQAYESIGLGPAARIAGSGISGEGYRIDFNLNTGDVTYTEIGGGDLFGGLILAAAAAIFTGPLAAALGPASAGGAGIFSSAAAAKAASGAILSSASQLAATGELDIGQALVSAAMSYGGTQLGDAVKNSGVIGDIASQVESTANSAVDFLSQGNSIAEAAIKAGGMSMLSQLVTTGEVSLEQAGIAALIAGGAEGINELAVASGRDVDEFMADLAEQEEFQQAAIDADIKDPFLNPNYQTVGDGSVVLNTVTNEVFSVSTNQSLGQFDSLDANSDGVLSASDLQEAGVTAQQVTPNVFDYKMGDNVIVTADGTTLPKNSVLVATRDGGYYSYDADGNKVDVTLKTYNEVFGGDRGGLVWNSEGGTEGTINYENGDLAYQKVSTTQTLYDAQGNPYESEVSQWVDAQGNIVDDPQLTDELTLIAAKAIDTPLESVTYYDQDGNPIDYNYAPYKLRDSYESGQYSGTIFGKDGSRYQWDDATGLYKYSPTTADAGYTQEVWYDPTTGTEYVKVEDKLTINKVDLNNVVEPEKLVTVETTDVGGASASSQQAVTDLTESLSNASSSEAASQAVTSAAASGLSATQIATAVNSALSGGSISSETASAASSALEGITSKGDVSDAGVLSASGDLATDTGSDGATVTAVNQPSGLLTGSNITTGAGVSASAGGDARLSFDDFTGSSGDGRLSFDDFNVSTGGVTGGGLTANGVTGANVGAGNITGGSGLDGPGVDGAGVDESGVNGGAKSTTTIDTSITTGSSIASTAGPPGPGATVSVGNENGKGPGKGPGDGPGDNGDDGLGRTGMLAGLTALPTMAQQQGDPFSKFDIRIQAPEMLPDVVRQQDAVAQLASALSMPYGDKPSGRALNSLFGSLLNEKAV